MLERISEHLRIPSESRETIEPIGFADDSEVADLILEAEFQNAAIKVPCRRAWSPFFTKPRHYEKACPLEYVSPSGYMAACQARKHFAHQMRLQTWHEARTGNDALSGHNAKEIDCIGGIESVDFAPIRPSKCLPTAPFHVDFVANAVVLLYLSLIAGTIELIDNVDLKHGLSSLATVLNAAYAALAIPTFWDCLELYFLPAQGFDDTMGGSGNPEFFARVTQVRVHGVKRYAENTGNLPGGFSRAGPLQDLSLTF